MSTETIESLNPMTITLNAGETREWETTHDNSAFQITIAYRSNAAQISISGAPSDASLNENGKIVPMNGVFTIPANNPDYSLLALNNYHGAIITFTNITNQEIGSTTVTQIYKF